jgi:hypothetical protein
VELDLTPPELRVLGCLLEKELATPQYYPLTLNALVMACNQSSNRDPVVAYTEADVAGALGLLRDKTLARVIHSGSGSRVEKYRHAVDERWGLDAQHRAVLTVMLLRGPQTVGELRTRTDRLATFDSLGDVEEVLSLLARREQPLAHQLERAPGQKEARWIHLLGEVDATFPIASSVASAVAPARVDLASQVEELRAEVAELREMVELLLESTGTQRSVG